MDAGVVRIMGIQSYDSKTKDGLTVTNSILHYCEEFNDYDNKNGAVGVRCINEFTRIPLPQGLKINDYCRLVYSKGFQDKAVLSNIIVLERPSK